jgi:hypothetical protein
MSIMNIPNKPCDGYIKTKGTKQDSARSPIPEKEVPSLW